MFFQRIGRSLAVAFSLLLSLSLFLFLFLFLFFLPSPAQAGWEICTIQRLNHFAYWYPIRSLALDDQGCAHLAYGSDILNYIHLLSTENNLAWLVESASGAVDVKGFAALALDASNNPHLCCISNGCLIYAHKKGMNWSLRTIDDSKNIGSSLSMALDSQGSVHISYYDCKQKRLHYVFYHEDERNENESGSNEHESELMDEGVHGLMVNEIIDDSEESGVINSLALDLAGCVHIAYYDRLNQDLKYACKRGNGGNGGNVENVGNVGNGENGGNGWTREVVDSDGDVGFWPALVVDRDGNPCICYSDWTHRTLKYARRSSGGWSSETVDNSSLDKVGGYTAIALDHEGRPHISYFNWSEHAVMYAVHDGSAWQIQMVNKDEDIDGTTSLALDSSGQAHIIYYNYTTNSLKYALLKEDTQLKKDVQLSGAEDENDSNKKGSILPEGFGCFLSSLKPW